MSVQPDPVTRRTVPEFSQTENVGSDARGRQIKVLEDSKTPRPTGSTTLARTTLREHSATKQAPKVNPPQLHVVIADNPCEAAQSSMKSKYQNNYAENPVTKLRENTGLNFAFKLEPAGKEDVYVVFATRSGAAVSKIKTEKVDIKDLENYIAHIENIPRAQA